MGRFFNCGGESLLSSRTRRGQEEAEHIWVRDAGGKGREVWGVETGEEGHRGRGGVGDLDQAGWRLGRGSVREEGSGLKEANEGR